MVGERETDEKESEEGSGLRRELDSTELAEVSRTGVGAGSTRHKNLHGPKNEQNQQDVQRINFGNEILAPESGVDGEQSGRQQSCGTTHYTGSLQPVYHYEVEQGYRKRANHGAECVHGRCWRNANEREAMLPDVTQ